MAQIILERILEIIDSNKSLEIIRADISSLRAEACSGDNQLLILLYDFLSEYSLPISADKELHFWRCDGISESEYESIKYIHSQSHNNYFLAISGELLWKRYHEKEYADTALKAYLNCLEKTEDVVAFNRFSLGVCRIVSRYKVEDFDIDAFCDKCITHIKDNFQEGFSTLFLMQGIAKIKHAFAKIEKTWQEIVSLLCASGNYSNAIKFAEKLADEYKSRKKKIQANALYKQIAEMYEAQANTLDWENPQEAHQIIYLIQRAMGAWKISNEDPTRAEQKRLAIRIEPIKALQLQALKVFKTDPIDISDLIKYIEETIDTQDVKGIIIRLITLIPLKSLDKLLESSNNHGYFSDFFTTHVLTGYGKTRCILPSRDGATKEEMISILQHEAYKNQTMISGDLVLRFLHIWNSKVDLTESDIRFLVENNVFIPEDRKESFLKGLYAGFKMDYITAMSILMPQVENAIRSFAEKVGIPTFYTDDQGIDHCFSMSTILDMPEFVEHFDDEFIFYLKVHYTSSYGFGMRDDVAHGLLSDRMLNSKDSVMVWWYTLRLCVLFCSDFYRQN